MQRKYIKVYGFRLSGFLDVPNPCDRNAGFKCEWMKMTIKSVGAKLIAKKD